MQDRARYIDVSAVYYTWRADYRVTEQDDGSAVVTRRLEPYGHYVTAFPKPHDSFPSVGSAMLYIGRLHQSKCEA